MEKAKFFVMLIAQLTASEIFALLYVLHPESANMKEIKKIIYALKEINRPNKKLSNETKKLLFHIKEDETRTIFVYI